MIKEYKHGEITWVDLTKPTQDEVRTAMQRFDLPPTVAQELFFPSVKPKTELYENYFYLILHFPAIKHAGHPQSVQELDFIIGKNIVLTTHYDGIDPVHKFVKEFELSSILDKKLVPDEKEEHGGHLFYVMLAQLYEKLGEDLSYVEASLEEIEEMIFQGKEKDMVFEISNASRVLISYRQALISHSDILETLKLITHKFFGESYDVYVNDLINQHFHVTRRVEQLQDVVKEIRETNFAILSTKQNEVMKILTIMAFVTFPLSLFASLFGMNTTFLPIVGLPYDFWVIVAAMLILTIAFFIYFKQKKWL